MTLYYCRLLFIRYLQVVLFSVCLNKYFIIFIPEETWKHIWRFNLMLSDLRSALPVYICDVLNLKHSGSELFLDHSFSRKGKNNSRNNINVCFSFIDTFCNSAGVFISILIKPSVLIRETTGTQDHYRPTLIKKVLQGGEASRVSAQQKGFNAVSVCTRRSF